MLTKGNVLFSVADHPTPKVDDSGIGYTLNSRDYKDAQCVVYRKQGHPQTSEQGQGWKETEVNDTLNVFDSGETRTPTVIIEKQTVYDWHRQDTRMTECGDICVTAAAGWGGWRKQHAVCFGGTYNGRIKRACVA